jgi:hypothetical protein
MTKGTPKINLTDSFKEAVTQLVRATEAKTVKVDKALRDRVNYAVKGIKAGEKVDNVTLRDLIKDISSVLNVSSVPAPVEAQVKRPAPKAKAPAKVVEAESEDDDEPEVQEAPKSRKPAPKAPAKTSAPAPKGKTAPKSEEPKAPVKKGLKAPVKAPVKKETPKVLPTKKVGTQEVVEFFPDTIEDKTLGTLTAQHGKYMTVKEINEAIADGETLLVGTYWNERQIKQFGYEELYGVKVPNGKFPNDMDILQVMFTGEKTSFFYAMSLITEAVFRFGGDSLKPFTDNGKKVRIDNGMEYELYKAEE